MAETIDAYIGGRSLVELQDELGSRGVVSEVPMPKYGYMRKYERYHAMIGEDLINDWAIGALGGLIYTDRKGRNAGKESPYAKPHGWTLRIRVREDGA